MSAFAACHDVSICFPIAIPCLLSVLSGMSGKTLIQFLTHGCVASNNQWNNILQKQGSHIFFPMIFQNFSRTFPEYLTQCPGPYIIIISAMMSLIPMFVFTPSTLATCGESFCWKQPTDKLTMRRAASHCELVGRPFSAEAFPTSG